MHIRKPIFISSKVILYLLVSILLLLPYQTSWLPVVGLALAINGALSFLFALMNRNIKSVSKRNNMNGVIEIVAALSILFVNQLPFSPADILAILFIALAYTQLSFAVYTGYRWVKSNVLISLFRILVPLFVIIPTGLILGNYVSEHWGAVAEYDLLGVLFFVTAFLNLYLISRVKEISYTSGRPARF